MTATSPIKSPNSDGTVVVDQNGSPYDNLLSKITAEDQRQMEEDECQESLELARQLMAEEAMLSYQQHFELLRDSANEYSSQDLEAFRAVMAEEDRYVTDQFFSSDATPTEPVVSYETMLFLGERIGDVKSERWSIIAKNEMDKLPTFLFDSASNKCHSDHLVLEETLSDSDSKCLVCQCRYQHHETLIQLPCQHCFHQECAAQWLQTKDTCPYCRQSIVFVNGPVT